MYHHTLEAIKRLKLINQEPDLSYFAQLDHNPNAITDEHLHLLGKTYLQAYPEKRNACFRFFAFHTNQSFAKEMSRTQLDTPEARWHYLKNLYSHLPNTNGKLAETIKNLFSLAFGYHYKLTSAFSSPFGVHVINYTPTQIAAEFTQSINRFYQVTAPQPHFN